MGTFQAGLIVFSPLTSSDTALTKLTSACDFLLTEQCSVCTGVERCCAGRMSKEVTG